MTDFQVKFILVSGRGIGVREQVLEIEVTEEDDLWAGDGGVV